MYFYAVYLPSGFLAALIYLIWTRWLESDGNRIKGGSLHHDDWEILAAQGVQKPLLHRRLSHISYQYVRQHVNVIDLNDKLLNQNHTYQSLKCLHTKTEPAIHICTYPPDRDKYISAALQNDGVWEPYITPLLQATLHIYPHSLLIDVGANIGYYSLLTAKMGHNTIAIEPKEENLLRLQMGINLNGVSKRVLLVKNVLFNLQTNVTLTDNADNQGGIWIKSIIPNLSDFPQNETVVEATTMDHLLTVADFREAIIKIDIEGYECKAMKTSRRLFNKVFVPYIFMEWGKMFSNRHRQNSPCPATEMNHLAIELSNMGYIPYEVRTGFQLSIERCTTKWKIGDIYWRHNTAKTLQDPF